jgi:hypothetical protein
VWRTAAAIKANSAAWGRVAVVQTARTSPPCGPGPSLTSAVRDGRTIVRAGTQEWLRQENGQEDIMLRCGPPDCEALADREYPAHLGGRRTTWPAAWQLRRQSSDTDLSNHGRGGV